MAGADAHTIRYVRPDGRVAVVAWWRPRGGCLWVGEVTVLTVDGVLRFASTTPLPRQALAGYATDEYLARHAKRISPRPPADEYLAWMAPTGTEEVR